MEQNSNIANDTFSLNKVCWGYRDVFEKTIQGLFNQGYLGPEKQEVTERLFDVLKRSERNLFDHVLKEFLDALSGETAWILDLPVIFDEVVTLGCEFSDEKLYYGIQYFRILGDGGFGKTPELVNDLIGWLKRLKGIDPELAFSFLKGYSSLSERLMPKELNTYVEEGLKAYTRSKKTGYRFMETELASCETIMLELTKESRLDTERPVLERLLKALTGRRIEIQEISQLDADELILRHSGMVCITRWLYLPSRIRTHTSREQNRAVYLLQGVAASAAIAIGSFPVVHGQNGFASLLEPVGGDVALANAVVIVEILRLCRFITHNWPGAVGLLEDAFAEEFRRSPVRTSPDSLLAEALKNTFSQSNGVERAQVLIDIASVSVDVFDSILRVRTNESIAEMADLSTNLVRAFPFLPDFLYSVTVKEAANENQVADLKDQGERNSDGEEDGEEAIEPDPDGDPGSELGEDENEALPACYLYDEWSIEENDYYRDYCSVYEIRSRSDTGATIPEDYEGEIERIRRIFEMLKPTLVHKVKYLSDGDDINTDMLLDFLVSKRKEPSPQIRFYEKPFIEKRDLAVLILLDVSGSTDEAVGNRKVIDIEKHAGLILGQGLASLGDQFAICGFSGNGREDCRYLVFKDFHDEWDSSTMADVLTARPMSSTRIGAALRHAGYRLESSDARQRLIILVTDGRPMDQGYDPGTRYAQHDVRMACEENRRSGIYTFCISTMENSRADMEIMFPERRFVILEDIADLPRVLPSLYIKMTV